MKKVLFALALSAAVANVFSQTFITRSGYAGFFSKTPLEDIRAENNQVLAVIDVGKKNLAFTCLVRGFLFKKALMQEHFNENYIESEKYPKASFSGSYSGNVNLAADGEYPVIVAGHLTLHGVTKTIEVPATLQVKNKALLGSATFQLLPGDFNINIPGLVKEKIAKQIDVRIQVECQPK